MKRYTFRLEQVRRIRRLQEDVAKGELAAANHNVLAARTALTEAVNEYERAIAAPAVGTNLDAFNTRRYMNQLAGQAVMAAEHQVAIALELADQKRLVWSEAASKVKVLDRLDDRNRAEHELESQRETEMEVDDVVTGRFARAGGDA